jgi:CRP-like cAMP-binding protein
VTEFTPLLGDLEKMTISLERETFEAGDTIIRQGNTGDHFYIISEGTVGVYKADESGKETKLAMLHQGNYFG